MEWIELDARLEEKKRALARRQQREAARRRKEDARRRQEQEKLAARCHEMAVEDALSERMAAWIAAQEERKRADEQREADTRLFRRIAVVCRRAKELGVPLSTPGVPPEERLRLLNARIEAKEMALKAAQEARQRLDELPQKRSKVKQMMRLFFTSSVRKKMEKAVFNRACTRFIHLLDPASELADNKAKSLLNHESENNLTPALAAIFTGELTVLRKLLQCGASVDFETKTGMTPLMAAVMADDIIAVSILVEFNADLNYETAGGVTPLVLAADKGRSQILRALLKHGASVNAVTTSGRSALIQATIAGHYDAVHVLLANNADKCIRDNSGRTALNWAEQLHYTAIRSLFSDAVTSTALEAQLKAQEMAAEDTMHSDTSSHYEVQRKRSQTLEKFMKERNLSKVNELLVLEGDLLSPNYEDSTGMSPLLLSCAFGTFHDVLRCFERKCIPTHQNREGVTALMMVCKRGDKIMIDFLIKAGCDLLTRDFSGRDSFTYLNLNDCPSLAEQLTNAYRSARSKLPLTCLGTPIMSLKSLASNGITEGTESSLEAKDRFHAEGESLDDHSSEEKSQSDCTSDDPVQDPNIRRWGARQRVLKKNRQRREQYNNERQKILAAVVRGRRNGLIAPLREDPKGRWKYPKCSNCKQGKARKRCFNCEQVLCDKCHARLHELAHRRHHTYEEVSPKLYVGDELLRDVQERNEGSFDAVVARSRDCISAMRAVLQEEFPQSLPTMKRVDPEVERYSLTKRVEREREVTKMQLNVPVAAAKKAAANDEGSIFVQPTELELAKLYVTQKKYEKARTVLLQAKKIVESAVGVLHPTMLQIAIGIGRIDQEIGQSGKCTLELDQALTVFESVLPPNNQDFIDGIDLLLTSLDTQGRYEDAVRMCRRFRERNRLLVSPIVKMSDRLEEFKSKYENAQMSEHDELVLAQVKRDKEEAERHVREMEMRVAGFRDLLLHTSKESESFYEFARRELTLDLVNFWVAVEEWKQVQGKSDSKSLRARAVEIYITFIKSRRIKVITTIQKKRIKKILTTPGKHMSAIVFDEAQTIVFSVLFNDLYSRFLEVAAQNCTKK